jgi:plasmid maintenance system antidote protein VapI
MTPMMKIIDIAEKLNRDPADISRWLSGKRKVSWPFAADLARLFPAKTQEQWKNASPEEIRAAFKFLEV